MFNWQIKAFCSSLFIVSMCKRIPPILPVFLCCMLVATAVEVNGQKNEFKSEFELLFFTQHIWRGEAIGNPFALEPSITISKRNFALNLWAATTFDGSYAEIDIIPSYNFKQFTFYFFDYYNPIQGKRNNYFTLKDDLNRHSFELALVHNQIEEIHFTVFVGTFVFGDNNPMNDKPRYSTYVELTHRFDRRWFSVEPSVGLTPFKGYYADNFAVINCRLKLSKKIVLNKHLILPLQANAVYNPYKRDFSYNLALGFTLH